MSDLQVNEVACPGLPADWINAWLAAMGATVLGYPDIRLHWTREGTPMAVLSAAGKDPLDVLVKAWPDKQLIAELPIAEVMQRTDCTGNAATDEFPRRATAEHFRKRAALARASQFSWTLSSTVTDLCIDGKGEVQHARFDAAAPGPAGPLHRRLRKVHDAVKCADEWIELSLHGKGKRTKDNGLAFDSSRLASRADGSDKFTDPVIEVLAFFGLAFLLVRGRPTREKAASSEVRQRGWTRDVPQSFHWPAWTQALNRDGIDALLSAWHGSRGKALARQLTVFAAWRTMSLKTESSSDTTRAFSSRRLR